MKLVKIIAGSRALRVAGANSDNDWVVIEMPTLAQAVGLVHYKNNRQEIVGKEDTRTYSLPHFAKQVMAGNANYVQALWMPAEYASPVWREMIEPYSLDLFDYSLFAVSAVHVANALLRMGTGKSVASGMAMLLFASNILHGAKELPYSHVDYQIIRNASVNGGWIDLKLTEELKSKLASTDSRKFDQQYALSRFTAAMKTAMRANPD